MRKYAFGVDIGGTTEKMGLFTTGGELLEKWEIPTDTSENGAHILGDIAKAIESKMQEKGIEKGQISGIGMGVPGPVDEDGVVHKCVNLGWGVFNIEETMSQMTGLPCKAGNDANVAALGEMYRGGGAGSKNMVMITLGTGVGGGIIVNGKILAGCNGAAGEVGHFTVNEDEPETCGCGKHGCLEQYASARGIANMAKKKLAVTTEESVLRKCQDVTAKDIFDGAKAGDDFSLSLVDELGKMIGKACSYIACVTNPEVFVVGGGVSKAGTILTDVIRKHFREYAFHASRETPFVLATLGNDAGIYGGVKMVL